MLSSLLTFLLIGFVALVALSVIGTVLGIAVGLAGFLLFKVAPIVLIGYVIVRLLNGKRKKQLSSEDQRWLES